MGAGRNGGTPQAIRVHRKESRPASHRLHPGIPPFSHRWLLRRRKRRRPENETRQKAPRKRIRRSFLELFIPLADDLFPFSAAAVAVAVAVVVVVVAAVRCSTGFDWVLVQFGGF